MSKNILFLKDSEINDWLIDGFSQKKIDLTFFGIDKGTQMLNQHRFKRIIYLHFGYLVLSIKGLFKSKRDDIIICYLDVLALYVFISSKIFMKRRNIIVINVMFNDNNDIVTRIKYKLFKWMLNSKKIYPCVTSIELQMYYNKLFDFHNKSFELVHDCYGRLENFKRSYTEGDGYVFCGGTNGRDWDTLVRVASILPSIKFVIVGPKKETLGKKYPSNIRYYHNISFNKFQLLMEKSSICALPLNTEAPAGLIVLYTAGLMSKPVVTTNNVTMREYIDSGENGFLIERNDYRSFADKLSFIMEDKEYRMNLGISLHEKVNRLGSPQNFIENIIKIVDKIKDENITN